jgi:hypothetical protein
MALIVCVIFLILFLFFLIFFLLLFYFAVGNLSFPKRGDKIVVDMLVAMRGKLCNDLNDIADEGTPFAGEDDEMTNICNQSISFETFFGSLKPTQQPTTGSPSTLIKNIIAAAAVVQPIDTVPVADVNKVLGGLGGLIALCIFGVWGFLRCLPCCVGLIVVKKERGHLYDILVIVDDTEELILKNIRHEDIAYFRKADVDSELTWDVNDTNDIISKRFEVEFFDRYDLMGRGCDTTYDNDDEQKTCNIDFSKSEDKVAWREAYAHQSSLETGMIIRVSPGNPIYHLNPNCNPNLNSYPDSNSIPIPNPNRYDHQSESR